MPASDRREVVVVADDDDLRLLITLSLRRDRRLQVVDDAATAEEALDRVAARRPDLIVLDDRLGDVRGVDLAAELVAATPRAMVLLLGPPFSATTVRSIAVDGLLPKDRLSDLAAVATRLLELEPLSEE